VRRSLLHPATPYLVSPRYVLLCALALAVGVALLFCGCAHVPTDVNEAAVRGALSALSEPIDAAYSAAVDGCLARQEDATRRIEAGSDGAKSDFVAITARCKNVRDAFGQIREAHEAAAAAVEDGALERARRELERVREGFATVRKNLPQGASP